MPIVNVTEIFSKDAHTKLPFEATIDALIEGYPCIAFSKSYCQYNAAVKDLLALQYGVLLLVIDINQAGSASDIQRYLQSKTGIATVPQVFVDGQYLGNHDDIMELHAKGELYEKLGKNAKRNGLTTPASSTKACTYTPLFWFPQTVNKWAIRATGLLSCVVSSSLAVAMLTGSNNSLTGVISLALFADFVSRFLTGSQYAPLARVGGQLASVYQTKFQRAPISRPGAPKQFASFCGTMFSGLGALSYHYFQSSFVGGIFLLILAVCTGMEGGMDFCLGCKFFAIGETLLARKNQMEKRPARTGTSSSLTRRTLKAPAKAA